MEIALNIKRQVSVRKKPYYQKFYISASNNMTLLDAIKIINSRSEITDAYGKPADAIYFESECEKGECGKCHITVNGNNVAACKTTLASLCSGESGNMLIVEPAKGMKVIKDLIVERTSGKDGKSSGAGNIRVLDPKDRKKPEAEGEKPAEPAGIDTTAAG